MKVDAAQALRIENEFLAGVAAKYAVRAVTFGEDAEDLASAFRRASVPVSSHELFELAVGDALLVTPVGGTLLFSPACASFDAFPNFRERARAFERHVMFFARTDAPAPGGGRT